jgi:hypothetical protein
MSADDGAGGEVTRECSERGRSVGSYQELEVEEAGEKEKRTGSLYSP